MTEHELFVAAVQIENAGERAAYVERETAGDDVLRQRVEVLLRAHADAAGFLESPPTASYQTTSSPAESVGSVVGPYKLLQLIGEGGMGFVWMAEQEQPLRRRVALKVIKPGMDSAQVIARFEAERQALALMDHPNIAKVLDAGTTPAGRPFFVMEMVKGVPITTYCDENRLTPHDRLELFVPVCQAIQHAHQKGIIHRDIKPSNVLVTLHDGVPVPMVIDFGVAKALHQRLTEKTIFTAFGQMVGTPEYMAPEQAELSGLDVDTRSDVYSLGVLLYELLTGTTPLTKQRIREAAFTEMLRLIREEEPPKPSTRLSTSDSIATIAAQRHVEPAKLSKLVRGELDWITMKALEKDRTRRYATANGFARDVQRYLDDDAVEAGPPSRWYRVRKFARHNKGSMLAAALVLLALVTGVGGLTAGWRRSVASERQMAAERDEALKQKRRTRAALDDMLSDGSLAFLTSQKYLLPAQREFLARALKYYREFAAQAATDEEGRKLEARAQYRVGRILHVLGQWSDAEAANRRAVTLYESLAADHSSVPQYRQELGNSHDSQGLLLAELGRRVEAEKAYRQALAVQERLAVDYPDVPAYRQALAGCHNNLSNLLSDLGRLAEAEVSIRQALLLYEGLAAERPGVPAHRRELAAGYITLGSRLSSLGRRVEAETAIRQALAISERLAVEYPSVPEYRHDIAAGQNNLATLLVRLGRIAEAESAFRKALAVREKLAFQYPGVPVHRRELARIHNNLGDLLRQLGKLAEAEAAHRQALAECERLVADDSATPDYQRELGTTCNYLGFLLSKTGKYAEAEAAYRRALVVREKLAAEYPGVPGHHQDLANSHTNLGLHLARIGNRPEADEEWRAAFALQERLAAEFPAVPSYAIDLGGGYCNIGNVVLNQGEPAVALGWFSKALAALQPVYKSEPRHVIVKKYLRNAHWSRADALMQLGCPAEALADWERAAELDEGSARTDLRLGRAAALARVGQSAKALAAADELAASPDLSAAQVYEMACICALAAAKLPPADADLAASKAVKLLRKSVAKGYRDFAHVLKDEDLLPIRGRDDFADLIWDWADALSDAKPTAK